MSLSHGGNLVTDGLVFAYDMGSDKSFKGGPVDNFAWAQNADGVQSKPEDLERFTIDATWDANHPDCVYIYRNDGGYPAAYINTGVNGGVWQTTQHAHWQWDYELYKPVVVMNDTDAQWKAKSWSLGQSMTSMGLGYSDTYTISWLQWTSNISKSANAGLYGQNTSATNGFWDGQSNAQGTSFNTKVNTWQRVYATFTVNAVRNLAATLSIFMYGHYGPRGTLKIADVQIERGSAANKYHPKTFSRSNTEAIIDWKGGNTITANSLTYNSDNTFSFDGSTNFISDPTFNIGTDPIFSVNMWIKRTASFANGGYWGLGGGVNGNGINGYCNPTRANKIGWDLWGTTTFDTGQDYPLNEWVNVCWVKTAATFTTSTLKVYINGEEFPLSFTARNGGSAVALVDGIAFGRISTTVSNYYAPGETAATNVFSRALSAQEIKQNFNALRGRFGI